MRAHGNCFGNWLLYHISKIMIRYILTGFELELYSVHEFSYIYWYLYEFLYGWLLSSLSRAETYLAEESNSKNKNKGNSKKGKFKASKAYTREICIVQAEQNIAGGIFKVSQTIYEFIFIFFSFLLLYRMNHHYMDNCLLLRIDFVERFLICFLNFILLLL